MVDRDVLVLRHRDPIGHVDVELSGRQELTYFDDSSEKIAITKTMLEVDGTISALRCEPDERE